MSDELYGTVTIDEDAIQNALDHSSEDHAHIREVLAKALELKGLNADDVAALMRIQSQELEEELFETARKAKMEIYGRRLVLFAPLYVSNLCANDCTYCAFRSKNKAVKRRALSQEEVAEETRIIINQGHKRILLVAGESYPAEPV